MNSAPADSRRDVQAVLSVITPLAVLLRPMVIILPTIFIFIVSALILIIG